MWIATCIEFKSEFSYVSHRRAELTNNLKSRTFGHEASDWRTEETRPSECSSLHLGVLVFMQLNRAGCMDGEQVHHIISYHTSH